MIPKPFALQATMPVADAMREAVQRHFPVYPVVDDGGRLVGLVRGEDLFQQRVFQLVVQAGSMVGVEKEERLATPWPRALRLRNPWLLLNLLTAFAAGAVVGVFEETIGKLVTLAAFLPILAGQSGNTGCQALAVTLRGMTLGELAEHRPIAVVGQGGRRSACSTAWWSARSPAAAMYLFARDESNALGLAGIVFVAMVGSCIASGISGALVPIGAETIRCRSGHRVEHLPHHRHRHREHGNAARPGDPLPALIPARSAPAPTSPRPGRPASRRRRARAGWRP